MPNPRSVASRRAGPLCLSNLAARLCNPVNLAARHRLERSLHSDGTDIDVTEDHGDE
jgi:hypothetical protein